MHFFQLYPPLKGLDFQNHPSAPTGRHGFKLFDKGLQAQLEPSEPFGMSLFRFVLGGHCVALSRDHPLRVANTTLSLRKRRHRGDGWQV
jgi:hypothetical protein